MYACTKLSVSLGHDECFADEESALLSLASVYGDGVVVLIDRPGPPRWLDVKVLSYAYGHITGLPLQIQTNDEIPDTRYLEMRTAVGLESTPAYHSVNISKDPMDETLIQRIKSWMARCSQEHGICRHMSNNQTLPTRVIKICGPKEVKVVEGMGRKALYSCLSYCWGSQADEVQTLTRERMQMYMAGIPWRVLPKTVAGAIQLARELGFTFIWVDAFCIIQDDPDDWLIEAGKMAEIYGHCSLTITTPQSDGASGDLTTRQLDACSMSMEVSSNNVGRRSVLMLLPRHDCTTMFKRKASPWMKRGWTLQEWLLSPRVLHCGAMAVWDCSEAVQYEDCAGNSTKGYTYVRPERQTRFANLMFGRLRRLGISSNEETPIDSIDPYVHWQQLWCELVEDFTSRQFTDPKDKLPALAGLALQYMKDEYAKEVSPEYLAGIWRFHSGGTKFSFGPGYYRSAFPGGLLWTRQPRSQYMVQPPPPYRAPSWSWAALDGPIIFMRDRATGLSFEEEVCLNVHEAVCEYRPSGSISSVTSGHIVADAPIKRAWIIASGDDAQTKISLATDDLPGTEDQGTWMAVFDQAPDQQMEIYLLRVFTKWRPLLLHPAVIHWALILRPHRSDGNVVTFVRLGVAVYEASRDPSKWSEPRKDWTSSHLFRNWERKQVVII